MTCLLKLLGIGRRRIPFDREREVPVLRCSICTGERVAGFRDRRTGAFREERLIADDVELAEFMRSCGISEIEREY